MRVLQTEFALVTVFRHVWGGGSETSCLQEKGLTPGKFFLSDSIATSSYVLGNGLANFFLLPPMVSTHTASREELKAAKVPIAWRDQCSMYASLSVWMGLVPTDH